MNVKKRQKSLMDSSDLSVSYRFTIYNNVSYNEMKW